MKAIFEIECKDNKDLNAQLKQLVGCNINYGCDSRLGVVKTMRDLFRVCLAANREPTLFELNEAVKKHVFEI